MELFSTATFLLTKSKVLHKIDTVTVTLMLPYDQCPYPYKLLEEQSEQQTLKTFC